MLIQETILNKQCYYLALFLYRKRLRFVPVDRLRSLLAPGPTDWLQVDPPAGLCPHPLGMVVPIPLLPNSRGAKTIRTQWKSLARYYLLGDHISHSTTVCTVQLLLKEIFSVSDQQSGRQYVYV